MQVMQLLILKTKLLPKSMQTVCIPLDFDLLETHTPFYQAGLGNRLEYELTFNDYDKVIKSSDADSSYKIKNFCLEFDKVTDIELARQIRQ